MWSLKEKRIGLALFIIGILYCFIEARGEGDLYIYLCAAGLLEHGGDIYLTGFIDEQYHYYYSVAFALLLKPFYTLPYYGVKACWLLLNYFLYLHLVRLLAGSGVLKNLPEKKQKLFLILSVVFSLRFFHENIHASQITILILWCCVYGLVLISKGKNYTGAMLIAIGINIKLLPLLLLPYLFYRGYFKALAASLLLLAGLYLFPSIVVGHAYNLHLLESWYFMINPVNKQHVLDVDERSFHGLSTLFATLFVREVPDLYAMSLPRNIMDVSYQTLAIILNSVRLFLLVLTILFVRALPFRKPSYKLQQAGEISYLLLLIPLLFPHQQHYAFLFICPAFCVCLFQLFLEWPALQTKKRTLLCALLSLVFLLSSLKMLVGEFNHYYEHYKILTYSALLLIPLLLRASYRMRTMPEFSEDQSSS